MQDTKDTFFVALRDRVAAGNPARTVVVRGVVRPGVMVEENELATEWIPTGVFSLRWTDAMVNRNGAVPLAALTCSIRYCTDGDATQGGMDRGRLLAQMDAELGVALGAGLAGIGLRNTRKMSYSSGAGVELETHVFWGDVAFGPAVVAGERLERVATVMVFGYLEAGGGVAGDFACVQVIERETGLQCAELRERLGALELARVVAALAREYGGALVAVERNNHGAGVLAYLDATERYTRVWAGRDGMAGWLTTAGSKPGMVSRMGALLVEAGWLFYSRRLLEECRTYVTMEGGRTGAASGAHDDCLMAMAVAQAVRAEVSCRTGPLRAGRAFTRLFTPSGGPPAGRE